MTREITVVAVLGLSYSGSTVLNYVLGAHPAIYGGGEVHALLTKYNAANYCTNCQGACPYWTPENLAKVQEHDFYPFIASLFGTSVVVDTSKTWSWFDRSTRFPSSVPVRFVPVVIIKHPLRHLSSFMVNTMRQKLGNENIRDLYVRHWLDPDEALMTSPQYSINKASLRRKMIDWYLDFLVRQNVEMFEHVDAVFPGNPYTLLRYENLAHDRAGELAPLLSRLGLHFHPGMDDCYAAEHHDIGGNAGASYQIHRNDAYFEGSHDIRNEFYRNVRGITVDNKYLKFFTPEEVEMLQQDERLTGLMRAFRYAPLPASE